MVFSSLTFVAFFAIVWSLHQLPLSWTAKKRNLLVASYLFYAAWNPPFVLLIWTSTLVDWFVARWLHRAETHRRAILMVSLVANLGLLGFFKYGDFLLQNFVVLAHALGIDYRPPEWGIALPVGISFYTFQTLSYTLDIYRRRLEPWGSFLDYALFVTFFPQLVAGPIVRAADFLPQCLKPLRANRSQVGWGLTLMVVGLFQKIVLADHFLAPVADRVFADASSAGFQDAWVGVFAFANQVFFDFAAYSTIAIGAALCLGFVLPDNFRSPFASIGFSDFWRRWHISLSSWLRDYVYISLGGNRGGHWRTYRNLMIVMAVGGLWHGASWQFVIFGLVHGVYLVVERFARPQLEGRAWTRAPMAGVAGALLTYGLFCASLVFFRSERIGDAFRLVTAMFAGAPDTLVLGVENVAIVGLLSAGLLAFHWSQRTSSMEEQWRRIPWWGRSIVLAILLFWILITPNNERAFVYFQF